jgi:glycosyltransferase involved in cell wall biosynthesis
VYAEVGNPVALAQALLKVLSDDEGARKLGIGLRQKAMVEYSWQSVGERITETYRQLTDSFATGRPA